MKFHEFSWKFQSPSFFPWPIAAKRTFNLPEKIRSSPIKLSSPDHRMRVFGHQSEKCEAILCTLSAMWFACCIPIVYSSCFRFCFLLTLIYSSRLLQSLQTHKCCIILPAMARATIYSIYIDLLSREHRVIESRLLSKSTRCRFLQVLNPTSDSYEFNWMPEEVDKDVAPQPGAMPFRCLTKYLDVLHRHPVGMLGLTAVAVHQGEELSEDFIVDIVDLFFFFEFSKELGNAFAKPFHCDLWLFEVKSRVRQRNDGVNMLGTVKKTEL